MPVKGVKQTPEHIAKRVAKQLGKKRTIEVRKEMSEARKNFLKNGGKSYWLGKKRSIETKNKLSLATKKQWLNGKFGRGNKSQSWRGGVTPIHKIIRNSKEYKLWKKVVLERDNYTCIWCGEKNGILEADHIKPFSIYPELRFAIDNGRTLCHECHTKTNTYGNKYNQRIL